MSPPDHGASDSDPRTPADEGGPAVPRESDDRVRTFAHYQRVKHGARVFRVAVGPRSERDIGVELTGRPGAATRTRVAQWASTRDEVIRGMVRLNDRHGATRFLVCLHLPGDDAAGEATIQRVRESVAIAPVVGVIVKALGEQITSGFLNSLRIAAAGGEVWIEVDLGAAEPDRGHQRDARAGREAGARAARLARDHAVGVIAAVRIGAPGESERDRSDLVHLLNRLRVRSVRFRPFTHLDGATVGEPGGHEDLGLRSTLSQDDYVERVAQMIEQLDPSILVQGLGSLDLAGSAGTSHGPRQAPDLHPRLEARLRARGTRHGSERRP